MIRALLLGALVLLAVQAQDCVRSVGGVQSALCVCNPNTIACNSQPAPRIFFNGVDVNTAESLNIDLDVDQYVPGSFGVELCPNPPVSLATPEIPQFPRCATCGGAPVPIVNGQIGPVTLAALGVDIINSGLFYDLCLTRTTINGPGPVTLWAGVTFVADIECAANSDCGIVSPAYVALIQAQLAAGNISPIEAQSALLRDTCCPTTGNPFTTGVCINPLIESCCGVPILRFSQKCCRATLSRVAFLDERCPCNGQDFIDETTLNANVCPTGERCCIGRKYPELLQPNGQPEPIALGQCFDETRGVEQCCDTGEVYNTGSQQCCPINGVQTLDVPCPCGNDGDCPVDREAELKCCLHSTETPHEQNLVTGVNAPNGNLCSKYINYPIGTGPYYAQTCLGVCYDGRYQMCCNGRVCIQEFEKCCNSTCCNRFLGSCKEAYRPGSPNQVFNWNNFVDPFLFKGLHTGAVFEDERIQYNQCTIVEQMSALRAFWIFVWPTALLLATVMGLAVALVIANRAAARRYHFIERALIVIGLLLSLFAIPLYFSPAFKYATVIVFVAVVAIIAAAIVHFALNILLIIFSIGLLFYLVDPITSNTYLTFSSDRLASGFTDPNAGGVLHYTGEGWRNSTLDEIISKPLLNRMGFCTNFYDYFRYDPLLHDFERFENPVVQTFGYCSRGYTFTLLLFELFLILFALLLAILAIIAMMIRFQKVVFEPVELELRGADEPIFVE